MSHELEHLLHRPGDFMPLEAAEIDVTKNPKLSAYFDKDVNTEYGARFS